MVVGCNELLLLIVVNRKKNCLARIIKSRIRNILLFVGNGVVVNCLVGTIDSVKNEIRTHPPLFIDIKQ